MGVSHTAGEENGPGGGGACWQPNQPPASNRGGCAGLTSRFSSGMNSTAQVTFHFSYCSRHNTSASNASARKKTNKKETLPLILSLVTRTRLFPCFIFVCFCVSPPPAGQVASLTGTALLDLNIGQLRRLPRFVTFDLTALPIERTSEISKKQTKTFTWGIKWSFIF